MADSMDGGSEFIDLGTDDPRVITMRITGKLRAGVITQLAKRLEAVSTTERKSQFDIDLVTFEDPGLAIVRERLAHIRTLWNAMEYLAYWAWMSKMTGLIDPVTPMQLRAFGHDEEGRAWLRSGE